jgi:Bacterial SH3 domain
MSTARLPIRRNSESIRPMKTLARQRCLSVATLSLLGMVALPAAAQEEAQPEAQQAETHPEATQPVRRLFVSDKLVLNVYSEPEQAGSRVATIETGDTVDELERGQGFVRIRLSDGREGWVGSNYLTTDAPAATQLRDLQRQQKGATQAVDKKAAEEIARLKKESEALQAQVKDLKAAAVAAPAPADEGVLEGASPAPQRLAATAPANSGSTWLWSFIVVLAAGLAYAAGYQSLARRIRKKFGGLRIY